MRISKTLIFPGQAVMKMDILCFKVKCVKGKSSIPYERLTPLILPDYGLSETVAALPDFSAAF